MNVASTVTSNLTKFPKISDKRRITAPQSSATHFFFFHITDPGRDTNDTTDHCLDFTLTTTTTDNNNNDNEYTWGLVTSGKKLLNFWNTRKYTLPVLNWWNLSVISFLISSFLIWNVGQGLVYFMWKKNSTSNSHLPHCLEFHNDWPINCLFYMIISYAHFI